MAEHAPTPPTVRSLLSRSDLGLRLASPGADAAALDAPVRWVHSSDLADPTPFLSEGLALLTTGTQFTAAPDDPDVYAAYVTRLAERGVVGLGFGTEVVRDGIPPQLSAACEAAGMPLFEVPYRTPFIAVARANADAVAAEGFARRAWALSAQRAVSLAALRADGLAATLAELSRQLGTWVGLYDAGGALSREHPRGALDRATADAVSAEVAVVLRRGGGSGSALRTGPTPVMLQTLGRTGHLRGVVAIAAGDLDHESRAVVTSVVAMAELALEQNDDVAQARRMLGDAVVHTLLAGDETLARTLANGLDVTLADDDYEIAAVAGDDDALDQIGEWLAAHPARGLVAGRVDDVVLVVGPDTATPAELAERFGVRVGLSRPARLAHAATAAREARAALGRGARGVARFGDAAASGVLDAIDSDLARLVAAATLAPLAEHDGAHGTELVRTLRVWLEHDARIDQAADALGVHRHTARTRLATAEGVLGADLSSFAARAELWAALRLTAS